MVGDKSSTKYMWVPKASLTIVLEKLAWVPKKVLLSLMKKYTQKKDNKLKTKQPPRVQFKQVNSGFRDQKDHK